MNTIIKETQRVIAVPSLAFGFGVFWFVWGKTGFWWGLLYGVFWPVWVGYHIASAWVK